jgi:hypothetical protein
MLLAVLELWRHAPDTASFIAAVLALCVLVLIWRGPVWLSAYTIHKVAMREQDRLDRRPAHPGAIDGA